MKIEYNNLYTHFVLITFQRTPFINSQNRERIEKYITGIVNNKDCKMYAIYANPQHVHFLISRFHFRRKYCHYCCKQFNEVYQ